MSSSTIFSKIISGDIPCEKVLETSNLIVIKDLHPVAPIHLLIIPKIAIRNIQTMKPDQFYLLQEVVKVAQTLAEELEIDQSGYRLLTNCEADGGQTIFHLHFHLIGGRTLDSLA